MREHSVNQAIRILVADDDGPFRKMLVDILEKNGYDVFCASDGREALDIYFANDAMIDLVILDVMMPGVDGLEAAREIRRYSDVAIMMLTALGDDGNEIKGLSAGADDYIAKPFRYGVFLARVQSLTRKARKEKTQTIRVDDLIIIQQEHKVYTGDREVPLSNKEYQLLVLLITNKNILLTREQMISHIWGYDFEGDIRTVDTHIKTLRAKLGHAGQRIETVRGSGYRFRG